MEGRRNHHDFRGFEKNKGTAGVLLPVSFTGVLLLKGAFEIMYNLSSLYLFRPFFITATFNKLSPIFDNHACDHDTRATKAELINTVLNYSNIIFTKLML